MKKTLFACAAIACATFFASCTSDIAEEKKVFGGKITLKASQEQFGGESTRTALAGDGVSVNWSEGDKFSVFSTVDNVNKQFSINDAGSSTSPFTGEVPEGTTKMYGLYPYNVSAEISSNVISGAVVPAVQHAVKGGFDSQAAIMTACTTNDNIDFKQVCCLIEVTTDYACRMINFSSNGSEKVAGTVSLTVDADGTSSYAVTANGTTDVSLVPQGGQESFEAGTYHIAVLPQAFASGFTIRCYKTDGTSVYRKITKATAAFSRAIIVNMGNASTSAGWNEHAPSHVYEFEKGKAEAVAVDLGLSIKWANMNLGATSPEEYGDYYAWGATVPWIEEYHINSSTKVASNCSECKWNSEHNSYDFVNTPYWVSGSYDSSKWSKYTASKNSYNSNGTADGKTLLESVDDAATHQWGSDWRMPTLAEYGELAKNTYWEWTDDYNGSKVKGWIVYKAKQDADKGVWHNGTTWKKTTNGSSYSYSTEPAGFIAYSLSDPHIFFPAAGYCSAGSLKYSTSVGLYWSATVDISNPYTARFLYFGTDVSPQSSNNRYIADPVRPVRN